MGGRRRFFDGFEGKLVLDCCEFLTENNGFEVLTLGVGSSYLVVL